MISMWNVSNKILLICLYKLWQVMSILSTIHSLLCHKQLIFQKEKKEKKKGKKLDTVKNIFQVQYDCQHVCHISYV